MRARVGVERASGRAVAELVRPNRRAVTEWTVARLYELIFAGEFQPGDALNEVELTERLGVSRSPVREALRRMEFAGVLESSPVNGQRVVTRFTVADIRELYDIRTALEALSARRAAERATDVELVELADIQHAMEEAPLDTLEGHQYQYELDFELHAAICRISGLARTYQLLQGMWLQTRALLRQLDSVGVFNTPEVIRATRQDHRELLECLQRRDPDAAEASMVRQLRVRSRQLIAEIERHGGIS